MNYYYLFKVVDAGIMDLYNKQNSAEVHDFLVTLLKRKLYIF